MSTYYKWKKKEEIAGPIVIMDMESKLLKNFKRELYWGYKKITSIYTIYVEFSLTDIKDKIVWQLLKRKMSSKTIMIFKIYSIQK